MFCIRSFSVSPPWQRCLVVSANGRQFHSDSHQSSTKTHSSRRKSKKHPLTAAERKKRERDLLRSHRMTRAFVASASLKPMAKQLLDNRTKAAYAGVQSYATRHAGDDAGMMADLVLGYAHILDRDYPAAIPPLKKGGIALW